LVAEELSLDLGHLQLLLTDGHLSKLKGGGTVLVAVVVVVVMVVVVVVVPASFAGCGERALAARMAYCCWLGGLRALTLY